MPTEKRRIFRKCQPEMQINFENEFPFEETADQLRVTEEIKRDMESDTPMDRILCGDVGYGKTEVAFRAMFKAVNDGKQVAYLCPTTILSSQQYNAAIERFSDFPINIALLNRFTSVREQTIILKKLKEGKIDILFGTHKVLNDKINFYIHLLGSLLLYFSHFQLNLFLHPLLYLQFL